MIWCVILGVLAAIGALFVLWLLLGALLPGGKDSAVAVLCKEGNEKSLLRRYRWLRELSLLRCDIVLLDSRLPLEARQEIIEHYPGVDFLTSEQWLIEIKERK